MKRLLKKAEVSPTERDEILTYIMENLKLDGGNEQEPGSPAHFYYKDGSGDPGESRWGMVWVEGTLPIENVLAKFTSLDRESLWDVLDYANDNFKSNKDLQEWLETWFGQYADADFEDKGTDYTLNFKLQGEEIKLEVNFDEVTFKEEQSSGYDD